MHYSISYLTSLFNISLELYTRGVKYYFFKTIIYVLATSRVIFVVVTIFTVKSKTMTIHATVYLAIEKSIVNFFSVMTNCVS